MKKIIVIFICILSGLTGFAQNKINAYEYWFDHDFQSKVSTNISPVVNFNLNGMISTSSLPSGLHVLNVRFRDDSSKYSQVSSSFFFKQFQGSAGAQNQIVSYEYWVDQNYASKTSVNITAATDFNLNGPVNTSSTVPGLHVFNVRFKDVGGKWSQVLSQFFYKSASGSSVQNNLVEYEYWYDNNYAAKINTTLAPQQSVHLMSSLNTASLPIGLHILNVRFKDVTGKWSQVLSQFFNKIPSSQSSLKLITKYQYWYDNNFAGNITQSVAPVADYQMMGSVSAATLTVGLHAFNVRFKDTNDLWSQVLSQFVYKSAPIPGSNNLIVGYRYWADNNFAAAVYEQLPLPIENLHLNTMLNMLNVPKGARYFNIQFRDTVGKWSIVQTDSFFRMPIPNASFYASTTAYCDSGTVSFINNSFDTDLYHWDFGDGDTSADASPVHFYTSPGVYPVSLLATDTLMNLMDDTLQVGYIVVNALPVVTATASEDTLCAGQSTILTAVGTASNYTWSNGVINNQAFIPGSTQTYTLTGSNGICANHDSIEVVVHALPSINVSTVNPNDTVCSGTAVTLSASGANTYTWNGPQVINNGIPFNAINSGIYTVTGTDANLCSNTASKLITVHTLPIVAVASVLPNDSVCKNTLVTMNGSGAQTYLWNGPQAVSNNIPFVAISGGTYTITGVDANACSNTATLFLTVHNLPNVSVASVTPNDTVCQGTQLTLSGGGAINYSWSGPQVITNAIPFSVNTAGVYTLTGTDANLCSNTAVQAIQVNNLPSVNVSLVTPNDTVCQGTMLTLAGSGALNYVWNGPQSISNNIPFSAMNGGVYQVTGTDANLCSNSSSVNITVNPLPVFTLGSDTSICEGTHTVLSQPFSLASVIWNDNSSADTLLVNQGGQYWCAVTQNGCTYTDSIDIAIDSLPIAHFGYSISNSEIDVTDSSKFAQSILWKFGDGATANVPNASHIYSANGNYTVTMIVTNDCGSDSVSVDIKIITGLTEQEIQYVSVYPNPSTGQFYIDLKTLNRDEISISLVDLKGAMIFRKNYSNPDQILHLDAGAFSAGTYLLRIASGDKIYVQRLSIVK
ncbi:MAG: PKD domain-containing protein [Chitinophagaceae bacterium]|nr:PKD domain-containing protein [Chitinophagaceae bacterium]